ncbi:uncharacterized protein LOC141537005 [Cotesia typhae]|uniref:uncharacterized protein LOC141537005 n=1 Tax=Cotesia typhae TaxID=2053667 RepID=UPI003D696E77
MVANNSSNNITSYIYASTLRQIRYDQLHSLYFYYIKDVVETQAFQRLKMPRKCAVPIEVAVKVIKRYISYFITDSLPDWCSEVWKKISEEKELKEYGWSIHSVRTNIREDRRNILTLAREECGYFIEKEKKLTDSYDECSDDSLYNDDNENDKNYVNKLYKNENSDMEVFDVIIDKSLWKKFLSTSKMKRKNM